MLGGAVLLPITSLTARTSPCQTPRFGLISSQQTWGCEPGQLRILPAPVKALPLCGGLGGDPRTPCSLSGLGFTKILAALSTHPPAPPALPLHPSTRWGGKIPADPGGSPPSAPRNSPGSSPCQVWLSSPCSTLF